MHMQLPRQICPRRDRNHAADLARTVQRLLDRRGGIRYAVRHSAKLRDIKHIPHSFPPLFKKPAPRHGAFLNFNA